MTDWEHVAGRVGEVRERIEQARARAGRTEPVELIAVTKTHPADAVRAALAAGVRDIAENRVGELADKVQEVGRDGARWHLIGHLQRNKIKRALALFDLLHSLDSHRLAEALSADAVAAGVEARVLVQVNASGEATKGGFSVQTALEDIAGLAELPGLRLAGVMTMAPFGAPEAVLRAVFARTRTVFEEAARQVSGFEPAVLSMGMSDDFEIAVEEGSTAVRVGTLLFGGRNQ